MNRPFQDFHGDIDALLEHCSNLDTDLVEKVAENKADDVMLNRQEMIDTLAEDFHLSKEEAEKYVSQIQMEEFHRICKGLVESGILEITGYDDEGPIYGPTEKAKKYLDQKDKKNL
jgi:hypothetical protein